MKSAYRRTIPGVEIRHDVRSREWPQELIPAKMIRGIILTNTKEDPIGRMQTWFACLNVGRGTLCGKDANNFFPPYFGPFSERGVLFLIGEVWGPESWHTSSGSFGPESLNLSCVQHELRHHEAVTRQGYEYFIPTL